MKVRFKKSGEEKRGQITSDYPGSKGQVAVVVGDRAFKSRDEIEAVGLEFTQTSAAEWEILCQRHLVS